MPYTRFHNDWIDYPSEDTPVTAAALEYIEGGIVTAQAAVEAATASAAAHLADTSDAHDASAISILDAANDFTATDVEGALAELQAADEADESDLAAHIAEGGGGRYIGSVADETTRSHTENNTWEDISGTSITFTAVADRAYFVTFEIAWQAADNNWLHHAVRMLADGASTGVSPASFFIWKQDSNGNEGRYRATTHAVVTGLAAGSRTLKWQTWDGNTSLDRNIHQTLVFVTEMGV